MKTLQKHLGFFRLQNVLEITHISESTWNAGYPSGRFPPKYNVSKKSIGWRKEDIHKMNEVMSKSSQHRKFFRWDKFLENPEYFLDANNFVKKPRAKVRK